MPPMSDHLELDAQPAIMMPIGTNESTAKTNSTPVSRFAKCHVGEKPMTRYAMNEGTKMSNGARRNSHLSAVAGRKSSLVNSFTTSIDVWKTPHGPTRFGPMRRCRWASTFRSM